MPSLAGSFALFVSNGNLTGKNRGRSPRGQGVEFLKACLKSGMELIPTASILRDSPVLQSCLKTVHVLVCSKAVYKQGSSHHYCMLADPPARTPCALIFASARLVCLCTGPEPCGRQQLQSPFAQLQPQTRLPPAFTTALSLAGQPAPAVTGTDLGGWRLLSAYLQQQQQAHTLADLAKVRAFRGVVWE
eukprot:1145376-Pelagomonas_calceolata.AAC.5